jgi:hypothetical protein
MTISDFIYSLQTMQEKYGDLELSFSVKDYYTTYGTEMRLNLDPVKHHLGYVSNGDVITITGFSLKDEMVTGKHPKITFRA